MKHIFVSICVLKYKFIYTSDYAVDTAASVVVCIHVYTNLFSQVNASEVF